VYQWSKNKEKKFIKLYTHNSDEDVAKILKVSYQFVQSKAEELGLTKEEPAKREWSAEEIKYINKMYADNSNEDIAKALGFEIQKWQIEHIAYRLGLRKSKEYMNAILVADDNELATEWSKEWHSDMGCSRGHFIVGKILKHLFPYHKVEEETPIGSLWIDWIIPQLSIAVEVHGSQHSEFSSFFHSTKNDFAKGQDNDWSKSEMLESQNISLIVVYHDEKISINLIKAKLEEII
jgi:very-short-patch-repair endonuclease